MRKVLGFSTLSLCLIFLVQSLFSQTTGTVRFVSNTNPTCNGHSPCYSTVQAAVNAAGAEDTIRIQAGTYNEVVLIKGKNNTAGATEDDRIILEADPASPAGSVIVGTPGSTCTAGNILQVESSKFLTIRGLTLAGAGKQAIALQGKPKQNTAIHIDRNRILGNGTCSGGLLISKGNTDTFITNNLIYGNTTHGINFKLGAGGSQYVVGNTIHKNGRNGVFIGKDQTVHLVNNIIVDNGADPKFKARDGFGVKRKAPAAKQTPELATLRHNLICGNDGGELNGPLLNTGTNADAGNLTPSGQEGPRGIALKVEQVQ